MYLLITRISISLSGKSIVFAIAIITTLAWGLLGHSNILQRTVCFFLQSMSSSSTRKMVWVRRGAGVENLVSSFFIACSCTNFSPSHFQVKHIYSLFLVLSLENLESVIKAYFKKFRNIEPTSFPTFHFISFSIITYHPFQLCLVHTRAVHTVHYSRVPCLLVQYSMVKYCSTVQYSSVHYSTVQYSTVHVQ